MRVHILTFEKPFKKSINSGFYFFIMLVLFWLANNGVRWLEISTQFN